MLDITVAEPQTHETLTIYPLVDSEPRHLPFRLLKDALEDGTLIVSELGDGSVPELQVENRGDSAVLILDGEQLIGAKQNRMTSRTILLGANSTTTIPVTCMEQGRWSPRGPRFRHGEHFSPAKLRRVARRTEGAYAAVCMEASPEALAEGQGQVWEEISDYACHLGERSKTGALNDLQGHRALDLAGWSKHFPWVDDQVGLLVFLGAQPLGMDVIGCHRLYARFHKRLANGYVLDALASRETPKTRPPARELAADFLTQVGSAERTDAPTVGRGIYRVLSGTVAGGELEEAERLVHLSAFPAEPGSADAGPPLQRARNRRRRS
jgi:hypothetical protein